MDSRSLSLEAWQLDHLIFACSIPGPGMRMAALQSPWYPWSCRKGCRERELDHELAAQHVLAAVCTLFISCLFMSFLLSRQHLVLLSIRTLKAAVTFCRRYGRIARQRDAGCSETTWSHSPSVWILPPCHCSRCQRAWNYVLESLLSVSWLESPHWNT